MSDRSPGVANPGATTDQTSASQRESTVDSTVLPPLVDCYSATSRLECARYFLEPLIAQAREVGPLPLVGSPEWVVADSVTQHASAFAALLPYLDAHAFSGLVAARNRRVAEDERRASLTAQRELSHAFSAAVNWSATDRGVSFAEIQERRAVVKVPQ